MQRVFLWGLPQIRFHIGSKMQVLFAAGVLHLPGVSQAPLPYPGPRVGLETGRTVMSRAFPRDSPASTCSPSQNVTSYSPKFDQYWMWVYRRCRRAGSNPFSFHSLECIFFQPLAFWSTTYPALASQMSLVSALSVTNIFGKSKPSGWFFSFSLFFLSSFDVASEDMVDGGTVP